MTNYDYYFILSDIPNRYKIALINIYKTCKNIYEEGVDEIGLVNLKIKEKLLRSMENDIELFKKRLIKSDIKFCTFDDNNYPRLLKYIQEPPYVLFYKGNIEDLNKNKNVAIVGSRNCSSYGEEATKNIINDMKNNEVNIISGGARGIDSIAHKQCIIKDMYTCSVFGCGIDIVYPKENDILYKKIIEKGCLISEFLPGTKPFPYNFPRRNRIISGLSNLVIIVEAGEKSGTLITADCALDQGRDVMVVPGPIFWNQSKGCNNLIKEGAYIYTNVTDIYELLHVEEKNKNSFKALHKEGILGIIWEVIKDKPIHIDDIIRVTNIDIKVLYELLFEMQLKEEIICLTGNYYVRNI